MSRSPAASARKSGNGGSPDPRKPPYSVSAFWPVVQDWDAAYSNRAAVPDHAALFDGWARDAAAFRDSCGSRARLDLPYGPGQRHRFDLFLPEGTPKGLILFIHGGYWVSFDKSTSSHLAAGPLAHGWAVAMPSYDLCPAVTIEQIASQTAAAIAAAAREVDGPLILTGHSAGGHLVSLMMCDEGPLAAAERARLARVVSISGLHDLRPLLGTRLNDSLRLTPESAANLSPALLTPLPEVPAVAWCGGGELPEFRRQNLLLAQLWAGFGQAVLALESDGDNHFTVIAPLADPGSALTAVLLGLPA
ncbi:alpha/beta hydrolase [Novispirillum itersonii]|uniref:alpha/beta hydrolase n=1 Tax=Novispirillum itersonii TaxID=189 RepID=UPI00037D97C4|nr:alpha/beta hydrolase [Novispirillum itersonii]